MTESEKKIDPSLEASTESQVDGQKPLVCELPMDDPDFREISEMFIRRLAVQVEEMQAAFENEDLASVREIAHALKGSGGSVGFSAFTEPAAELEKSALAGDTVGVAKGIEQIVQLQGRIQAPADSLSS